MKKTHRHDSASTPAPARHAKKERKREGRWEFTSSGSLFFLGAVDAAKRAAYRTTRGEMRFLPL